MSAGELAAALRQVAYWKHLAGERWAEICRLNAVVNEMTSESRTKGMGDLVPSVVKVPFGARDRENAIRLADENERLRDALHAAQARAVVLAKQLQEGSPS